MVAAIRVENQGRWAEILGLQDGWWRMNLGLTDSGAEFLYTSTDESYMRDMLHSWMEVPTCPFLESKYEHE